MYDENNPHINVVKSILITNEINDYVDDCTVEYCNSIDEAEQMISYDTCDFYWWRKISMPCYSFCTTEHKRTNVVSRS